MTAPTEQAHEPGAVPEANTAVVTGEVRRAVKRAEERRRKGSRSYSSDVLLLRAAPVWTGEERLPVDGRPVHVVPASTPLAVLEALTLPRDPGGYLVVLTPCDDLGETLLAQVVDRQVRPINRWDLVAETFGVQRLDPRLYTARWLAESLLDAFGQGVGRPHSGGGPVLRYDTAMRALAAKRLGEDTGTIDAATLLDWSRDEAKVAGFAQLRAEERDGVIDWLEQTVGAVARVLFRLFAHGHATDAIPAGLAVAPLFGPPATGRDGGADPAVLAAAGRAQGRAEERYFGGQRPAVADLDAFAEAVEAHVLRWLTTGRADTVTAVVTRAERILRELDATELAAASPVLDTGFDARITDLADEIAAVLPHPAARDLAEVEARLEDLGAHSRSGVGERTGEADTARAAVRLARWLATDEPEPASVAAGVDRHLRSWSWADRALAALWNPDTSRVPRAGELYARLSGVVRERRAGLDRAFARRLAAWSRSGTSTDELLLIENVQQRVARPVAERKAPLIVVIDGMTAAIAHALGEEITRRGQWRECARGGVREGALTVIPSITRYARASLLRGELTSGGQAEEADGFATFWRGRKTRLFHKASLAAGAGARLHPDVRAALKETSTVVGVVLNTIDEALDHGRSGDDHLWRLRDVSYLADLLDAAREAVRPVVLTADHGHVLDRGDTELTERAESARYRSGTPSDGEVAVHGPRVLTGERGVVAPWSERVRYIPRRAGYHGGVSAAEMVVPVVVLVPADRYVPDGWSPLDAADQAPAWWGPPVSEPESAPAPKRPARPGRVARAAPPVQDAELFPVRPPAPAPSLGRRVAESEMLAAQREGVRNAPSADQIAALIDALAEAGGKLLKQSAAERIGMNGFRLRGLVAQLARLLNVDGYQVIALTDGDRTVELNVPLLREQFLGDAG